MADQTFDNCPVRVVRDEEAGYYLIQVGVDGVYRTFSGFKLGKLDQMRSDAAAAAAAQPVTPPVQSVQQ